MQVFPAAEMGLEETNLWEPEHKGRGSRLEGKVLLRSRGILQLAENHESPVWSSVSSAGEAEQDGPVALSTGWELELWMVWVGTGQFSAA